MRTFTATVRVRNVAAHEVRRSVRGTARPVRLGVRPACRPATVPGRVPVVEDDTPPYPIHEQAREPATGDATGPVSAGHPAPAPLPGGSLDVRHVPVVRPADRPRRAQQLGPDHERWPGRPARRVGGRVCGDRARIGGMPRRAGELPRRGVPAMTAMNGRHTAPSQPSAQVRHQIQLSRRGRRRVTQPVQLRGKPFRILRQRARDGTTPRRIRRTNTGSGVDRAAGRPEAHEWRVGRWRIGLSVAGRRGARSTELGCVQSGHACRAGSSMNRSPRFRVSPHKTDRCGCSPARPSRSGLPSARTLGEEMRKESN